MGGIVTSSARVAKAIDPSGGNVLGPYNALYVGQAGDISLIPNSGDAASAVLFKAVPIGFFPVAWKQINQSGTTAAFLVALSW